MIQLEWRVDVLGLVRDRVISWHKCLDGREVELSIVVPTFPSRRPFNCLPTGLVRLLHRKLIVPDFVSKPVAQLTSYEIGEQTTSVITHTHVCILSPHK